MKDTNILYHSNSQLTLGGLIASEGVLFTSYCEG